MRLAPRGVRAWRPRRRGWLGARGLGGGLGLGGLALGGAQGGSAGWVLRGGCAGGGGRAHCVWHRVRPDEEGRVGGVDGRGELVWEFGQVDGHLGREVRVAAQAVAVDEGADVALLRSFGRGEGAVFWCWRQSCGLCPRRGGAMAVAAVHAAAAVGRDGGLAGVTGGAGAGTLRRDPSPRPWSALRPKPSRGGGVVVVVVAAGSCLGLRQRVGRRAAAQDFAGIAGALVE